VKVQITTFDTPPVTYTLGDDEGGLPISDWKRTPNHDIEVVKYPRAKHPDIFDRFNESYSINFATPATFDNLNAADQGMRKHDEDRPKVAKLTVFEGISSHQTKTEYPKCFWTATTTRVGVAAFRNYQITAVK
jgi:hypothetical protein